jgi:LacI family transcriptional regulator
MRASGRAGRRVTRDDVARLAGTSTAVVSYVINGGPRTVAEPTRQRVLATIAELGYRPNRIAQALAHGSAPTLALVAPNLGNPFIAALVQEIERAGHARDAALFVGDSMDDPARERRLIESLLAHQVSGLLWYGVDQPLPFDILETPGAQVVTLNQPIGVALPTAIPVAAVDVDEAAQAQTAAEHLIGHGRRRIALVAGPGHRLNAQERERGWHTALTAAGLRPETVVAAEFTEAGGAGAFAAVMAAGADAVVASNELQAVGILHIAHRAGVRVGDQLAVAAVNGTPRAAYTVPALTTVNQPIAQIARRAVDFALDPIVGANRTVVHSELVARASCGCGKDCGCGKE